MNRVCVQLLLFIFWVNIGTAQENDTAIEFPEFRFLRADENYSFLKDQYRELKPFWQKIKYLPLGENSFVSIGGDIRSEFQLLGNEDWEEGNDDMALFQRFMVHSDWRLGDRVRVFGQLKSGFAFGRNGPPLSLDRDELDVHQLFVGVRLGNSLLEVGRREIRYGARRLVSVREGTNVRQSFDGARWIWKNDNNQFDLLAYAYNTQEVGVFDNAVTTDRLLWGGYWVWNVENAENLNFDFYYLGVRNKDVTFNEGTADETRHSFGIRHWGSRGRWSYNNEAVFQTGSFGSGNISAWTISTDTYYQLSGQYNPTLGLKAEVISGDDEASDGDLQTFNPLYPRGGYFGLLALIGPANIFDIHPSLGLSFGDSWQLNLDWDFFWRHSLEDGIYFPSGRLRVPVENTSERFIGHQPGIQLSHAVNRFLEVEASYFLFMGGDFVDEVSDGARFSQFGTSIGLKF